MDLFAGTPGLKAIKMVISLAASLPERVIGFYDVSTAFFHARLGEKERIYCRLPPDVAPRGALARLKGALYGTRRASQAWQDRINEVMVQKGFRRLKGNPSIYVHDETQIILAVHGDDFIAVSTAASTAYQARMAESTRRCPTLSPITPNMGESSVPISSKDPNTASHVTDPVSVSTYQPRISVSISKAQEVARSAGH